MLRYFDSYHQALEQAFPELQFQFVGSYYASLHFFLFNFLSLSFLFFSFVFSSLFLIFLSFFSFLLPSFLIEFVKLTFPSKKQSPFQAMSTSPTLKYVDRYSMTLLVATDGIHWTATHGILGI